MNTLSAEALQEAVMQVFAAIEFDYQGCKVKGRFSPTWAARLPAILLSLGQVRPDEKSLADVITGCKPDQFRSSKETIAFFNEHWASHVVVGKTSKALVTAGNYDDFRDHGIIPLCNNGLAIRNTKVKSKNLNGKDTAYGLTAEGISLLSAFGTDAWEAALGMFKGWRDASGQTIDRTLLVQPAHDSAFTLHEDPHNYVQQQVIEQMLPRFAPDYQIIYTGDAEDRARFYQPELAAKLGLGPLFAEKMPDIVAWYPKENWIFIVEAVTSTGHIDRSKKDRFKELLGHRAEDAVFVTAFPNRDTFRRFAHDIAWETEVWTVDNPEHMIHFNGHRFLGPYRADDRASNGT